MKMSSVPTGPSANERRCRSHEVLLSICTAALEEVNGHDCKQSKPVVTRFSWLLIKPRGQLPIPSTLQPTRMSSKRSASHTPRQCWPEILGLSSAHACVMKVSTAMNKRQWESQEILLCICTAALEEVVFMNVSKRQVRGDHVQHAAHQPRGQLQITSSLQSYEDECKALSNTYSSTMLA